MSHAGGMSPKEIAMKARVREGSSLAVSEEAVEFSASGVEGALLIF